MKVGGYEDYQNSPLGAWRIVQADRIASDMEARFFFRRSGKRLIKLAEKLLTGIFARY